MQTTLARPKEVFGPMLPVTYTRGMDLIRKGVFPPGVIVRLGRQVFIDTSRLEQFIRSGGKALPGGWRLKANNSRPVTAVASAEDESTRRRDFN
jgi:hypothetical protein